MFDDTLITVDAVSKKFCRSLRKSLWYGMQDLGNEIRGRSLGGNGELRPDEFWAVNNVSFELKRGECLGLIGPNGAGKSTLLKILNGLLKPDHGRITMRGRTNALIALGAGFNPILTGRENIYVNGSVLGFSKKEIDRKLDAIVDFADLGEFIDMPVRNYSSGMTVRLGFSVAAQMEPDILILDEVLAVGDAGFKAKSFNTVMDIMQNAAVIFVSHSMPLIGRVATRILLMHHGAPMLLTENIGLAIDSYYGTFPKPELHKQLSGSGRVESDWVRIENHANNCIDRVEFGSPFRLSAKLAIDNTVSRYSVQYDIRSREQQMVLQLSSPLDSVLFDETGDLTVTVSVDQMRLAPGSYILNLFVSDEETKEILLAWRECLSFDVVGSFGSAAPVSYPGHWSIQKHPHSMY